MSGSRGGGQGLRHSYPLSKMSSVRSDLRVSHQVQTVVQQQKKECVNETWSLHDAITSAGA